MYKPRTRSGQARARIIKPAYGNEDPLLATLEGLLDCGFDLPEG